MFFSQQNYDVLGELGLIILYGCEDLMKLFFVHSFFADGFGRPGKGFFIDLRAFSDFILEGKHFVEILQVE